MTEVPAASTHTVSSIQLECDERLMANARLTITSVDQANNTTVQVLLLTIEQLHKLEADIDRIQGRGP